MSLAGVATLASMAYIGLRLYSGSQITYVTAAMLSRNLPNKETRIIQVGGSVKELYYYPKNTVQVTVMNPDLKEGLLETAAMQAGLPAVYSPNDINGLAKLGGAAADAIVVLGGMEKVPDLDGFFTEVQRVLKPAGRFIFIQPVISGQPTALQSALGVDAIDISKLDYMKRVRGFESVQWDVANEALSPHVVGLAIKRRKGKQ